MIDIEQEINCVVEFDEVRILYKHILDKDKDIELPWDILGFDTLEAKNDKWHFVLHCTDIVEYGFEAKWPRIIENNT